MAESWGKKRVDWKVESTAEKLADTMADLKDD